MLSKSHDSSARMAEKRIVCNAAVLSALLGALVFAGQAAADVPVPSALNSAATAATAATVATATTVATAANQPPAVAVVKQPPAPTGQRAVHLAVPAGETATQRAGNLVAPAINAATHSAGNVVVPALNTATQAAGNVVVPVIKSVTPSTGKMLAAATTNVTHGVSSVTRTVVNLANLVSTAPQGLVSSAPTAEDLANTVTHVAPHIGVKRFSRGINFPSSGSGSITRAVSPTTPGAAGDGGTFSGAGGVRVGGGWGSAAPRCALAGLEEGLIRSCGTGASRPPNFLFVLPFGEASTATATLDGLAARSASTAAHSGSPPDSVRGSPAPSPTPGGASGSTAAASGLALSMFLTLAGLLLWGPPRAMRRLRLLSEPWCTAPFVLMPERPG